MKYTEKEIIEHIRMHTPIAIKPTRKAKTLFVNPFSSAHAFLEVTEYIGKSVYKLLEDL